MTSVSASSATNAWAVGQPVDAGCGMAPLPPCLFASHWNGKKWQRLAAPPGIPVGDNPDAPSGIVAAIPGGRAWVFVYLGNNESGSSEVDAVEWRGRSWSAVHHFAGGPDGPIASGPDDVWGFESGNGTAWADHYNGKRWSQVPIPVIAWQASGSAAAGDWVTGRVAAQPALVEVVHWSKGAWRNVALPAISVPKGGQMVPGFIAPALSPASVWLTVGVEGSGPVTTLLLHWNGKAWNKVPVPKGVGIDGLASDGHGGAWVASYTKPSTPSGLVMYHYSGLRWTHVPVPVRSRFLWVNVSGSMELIPGTRSVLAPATLYGSPRNNGVILKYGP